LIFQIIIGLAGFFQVHGVITQAAAPALSLQNGEGTDLTRSPNATR